MTLPSCCAETLERDGDYTSITIVAETR